MALLGGWFGYRILKLLSPSGPKHMDGSTYVGRSKLDALLGSRLWEHVRGASVIDFGSGEGAEAIELAQRGASRVVGVEIQERFRQIATDRARQVGVAERVEFVAAPIDPADVVISIDSFEHFDNPGVVLEQMFHALRPGGLLMTAFGPTWFHPLGGHLFSVFPWAHLIFTEAALVRWRSEFKSDGATRFREVAGGLNQMTIRRFEELVRSSQFHLESLECVPIRRLAPIAARWNREFTTAIVRATLRRP